MANMTMQVQTAQGLFDFEVMHKNEALQVIRTPTQDPDLCFYSTVHDNGLRVPKTDTDDLANAISICDWSVKNFSELTTEIVNISKARRDEFNDRLRKFRFVELGENENDD